ncbi:MAG: HNH endonuclease [Pseudomonadota bacterium]
MNHFANTIAQVRENALKLHSMAHGDEKQRKWHQDRVRNAYHHVVLRHKEALVFLPVKWSAAASNSIETYPENSDPVTDRFRAALRRIGFSQVSLGHERHRELYDQFVAYCADFGFEHSKGGPEKRHYHVVDLPTRIHLADELDTEPTTIWEGHKQQITVNRYERSADARRKCIEAHGTSCVVCGFNFLDFYGDVGAGFIHVHHLVMLSEIDKSYKVNPIEDLTPVCPNCHAMSHRRKPPYSVIELKAMIGANH